MYDPIGLIDQNSSGQWAARKISILVAQNVERDEVSGPRRRELLSFGNRVLGPIQIDLT
jgi:hypothetical protein